MKSKNNNENITQDDEFNEKKREISEEIQIQWMKCDKKTQYNKMIIIRLIIECLLNIRWTNFKRLLFLLYTLSIFFFIHFEYFFPCVFVSFSSCLLYSHPSSHVLISCFLPPLISPLHLSSSSLLSFPSPSYSLVALILSSFLSFPFLFFIPS